MTQSKYDLILHPVRLQILHALEGNRRMTLPQLGLRLPDVSPSSLAQQLGILVESGMVVAVRSGDDIIYRAGETMIPEYERQRATPADHMRYFTTFAAGLIGAFSRYIKRPDVDVVGDRVVYRQRTLFLTDGELATLIDDFEARFDAEEDDPSNPKRKPHVISWIILPEVQPGDDPDGEIRRVAT